MTGPNDGAGTESSSEQPVEPAPRTATALETYIRENRTRVTEEALRSAALAAGHAPAAVDAALAATRGEGSGQVDRGRVVRNVFLAYLGVYLVLDVLMLINPANQGTGILGDLRGIGILILSIALVAGFVGSLVWIASRRAFFFILGCGIVLYGMSLFAGYQPLLVVTLGITGIGVALAGAALVYKRSSVGPSTPSVEVLMAIPLLLLLAVGGACVVSGLPIPRPL